MVLQWLRLRRRQAHPFYRIGKSSGHRFKIAKFAKRASAVVNIVQKPYHLFAKHSISHFMLKLGKRLLKNGQLRQLKYFQRPMPIDS